MLYANLETVQTILELSSIIKQVKLAIAYSLDIDDSVMSILIAKLFKRPVFK